MKHCEISIHVRIEIYAPSINELFHSISIFIRMQILRRISEAMKEEEEEEEGNEEEVRGPKVSSFSALVFS